MGDIIKFFNLFLSFLRSHPWQTLLVLLALSLLGNGYQYMNCKPINGSSKQQVAYIVVDSLTQVYGREVDHLRDIQLPDRPDLFAEVLETYFQYTIKAKDELRRLEYDKELSAEEKKALIETLQVNF